MTREEAIKRIKARFDKWALDDKDIEAIQTLIPELRESEDEKMFREIKRYIKEQGNKPTGLPNGTVTVYDMIDWLENQKEFLHISETCKENVNFTDENERIRKDIIALIKFGLTEGSAVSPGSHTTKEEALTYLEKLGEQKYLYYDQGFVAGMQQSKLIANSEIIVSPPKMTNKVSVSEELYEHIRETCACIDDAMSSKTLVDMTEYLEIADKSAQAAFDMLEKQKKLEPVEMTWNNIQKIEQSERKLIEKQKDQKPGGL